MRTERPTLTVLAATLLLAGCSTGVRLTDGERAALHRQPAIHVLHYESPLPRIAVNGKTAVPSAQNIRRHVGADPAALVATSFSRLLAKKENLKNLKLEPQHLPQPRTQSALAHKPKYRRGLTLELWLNQWSFESVPGSPGQVGLRLDAGTRLSRIDDGQVLWSTGTCRVNGVQNRDYRLATADLGASVKLRKVLAAARNECVRQLLRDFDPAPNRKDR